ncbi:MAG TPA: TonB-dependent receptor [Steroidobacteraceae bacterium]|nr:TonB-dependent receptor [Steroidobacteraceae bacterium]
MKHLISMPRRSDHRLLASAVAACLLAAAPHALSQSVSATLRGQVSAGEQPVSAASVVATNTETGLVRRVQTDANGNYTLAGLPPGTYKVEVSGPTGATARLVTLQVGQTAGLDLGLAAAQENIESVTVTATQLYETRTSEVATYVTPRQIELLPQNSRNFLAFADIVPGVQFATSADGATSEIRSGAQSANGVNVFIDGVGQKNYVLRGGVSGQTLTRGNPFPQLAIGEYKVITSNYKAEFDQLSSAAVVAVTRSGTNEFESNAFYDRTSENWRAADPIEARQGRKAQSKQEQYGIAFGGPIIRDRMHFFFTYEGKKFETPDTVSLGEGLSPDAAPPELRPALGVVSAPFDEDLYFGKIDWSVGDDHLLELTAKRRKESEISNIGDRNTAQFASDKVNDETRIDLRYQYTGARFLNDAHITYEDASFNPRPVTLAPGYRAVTPDRRAILNLGGGEEFQDKGQKGWGFQDDLTFTAFEWHGAHTVKTGVKLKRVEMTSFEQQPYNPQFFYDVTQDPTIPFFVQFGAAIPGLSAPNVQSQNRQYGIYIQDDWEATDKLLLNLGVRYDYEETPSYLDYVTPADVIAGIDSVDTTPGALPGQTYRQSLALGGVNIDKYLSNGHNRDSFDGAIQPRVGFSYDFSEDESFVLFGGAGRAYDRNVFDYLALERSKGTFPRYEFNFDTAGHPCDPATDQRCLEFSDSFFDRANLEALVAANPNLGREINLISNNLKTPYSDQFSLGVRNRFDLWNHSWNTSATVSYVESKDGIVFLLGNRRGNGGFRLNPDDVWGDVPFGNGIPGLGTLILIGNGIESRATALLLSAEKPYTNESKWGMTFAYTYTDAQENRTNAGFNDEHSIFDYPSVSGFGWHTATQVPRHRLVTTAIWDGPWDTSLSAKLLLQSPLEYDALNCLTLPTDASGEANCFFQNFKPDTTIGRKQLDLAASKSFDLGDFNVGLRADVLNVFNWNNPDSYQNFRGNAGVPSPDFGQITAYRQPTRTFKLSFNVGWR